MKVFLLNGSPHENGCTRRALREIETRFAENGIESEVWHIGTDAIRGCIGCGACRRSDAEGCVFGADDGVKHVIERIHACDAVIVGAPVHYAGIPGALKSLLDRVFFSANSFANTPAACVVSCRRGGASATFDAINKYFTISAMPVVSSRYWNSVHGNAPSEVEQDAEGLQVMRALADNMTWLLRCIEAAGIEPMKPEKRVSTNFIR